MKSLGVDIGAALERCVSDPPYDPTPDRGSRRMNQFGTPITGSSPITSKPKRS